MIINKKTILSKKLMATIAALLIVLATTMIYQNLVQTQSGSNIEESIEKKLAELFVKTILYLNQTRENMIESYYLLPHKENILQNKIIELIREYLNISKTLFFEENFPFTDMNQSSRLEQIILESFKTYFSIANTTLAMYIVSHELEEVMPKIAKSLNYLSECDLEKGVREYEKIEYRLNKIIHELNNIYTELASIDEKTLLSNEHRIIVEKTINTTSKLLTELTKYREIMNMIKANPTYYREICLYSHNKTANLSQNAQQLLNNLFSKTNQLNNLGGATNSLNKFKYTLLNAFHTNIIQNKNSQTGNQSSNQTNQQGQGSGAGYHNLTETD